MSDEEYARVRPLLQREEVVQWTLGWAIALTEMGAAIRQMQRAREWRQVDSELDEMYAELGGVNDD